ncbi:MAG: hypothetical protein IPM98_03275 [Lewinellaceae bacterium]|nr:hypothetical protein [Lewinellaceae bacterium]
MSKDWFEKALRDNYPAEAHDFDTDAAWAALEARRRKKRRRPFLFWWVSAIGVMLLGAAVLRWHTSGSDETLPRLELQSAPVASQQEPVAAVDKSPNESPLAVQQNVSINAHVAVPSETPVRPSATTFRAKRRATAPPPATPVISPSPTRSGPIVSGNVVSVQSIAAIPLPAPAGETHATEIQTKAVFAMLPLPEQDIQPVISNTDAEPELPAFYGDAKKRRKSKEPRWWIGVSAHYGLSLVSRTGLADYLKQRDTEETALDLFQTGLDFRRRVGSRYFVQTGLYFAQWTDVRERNFQETYTTLDSNYLIARIIRTDGTVENVYGPADITHIYTRTQETYNRYRHFELPLLAGISLPVGTQWRFEASAGPAIGLLSTRSGAIADFQNGDDLPLKNAPYRNSATVSGIARVEWLYATRGWAAGISILGRTALTNWAESNPAFSEKRSAIGAGLVFRKALR